MNKSVPVSIDHRDSASQKNKHFFSNDFFYKVHKQKKFPQEVIDWIQANNVVQAIIPEPYSDCTISLEENFKLTQKLAYEDISLAIKYRALSAVTLSPLINFGTEEMKGRILPQIISGMGCLSFALTEENAGSNPEALETTLTQEGDTLLLNGHKKYIGNVGESDNYIVFARHIVDQEYIGITACLIKSTSPGLIILEEHDTLGLLPITQQKIQFNQITLSENDLLGEPGQGNMIMQNAMQKTRLEFLPLALGALNRCIEVTQEHCESRQLKYGKLGEYISTQLSLNEMTIKKSLLTSLYKLAVVMDEQKKQLPFEFPLIAKIAGSEFLWDSVDTSLQLLGGKGYTSETPIARFFRDARVLKIAEGPNEALFTYLGRLSKLNQLPSTLVGFGYSDYTLDVEKYREQLQNKLDLFDAQNTKEISEEFFNLIIGKFVFYTVLETLTKTIKDTVAQKATLKWLAHEKTHLENWITYAIE